MTTRLPLLRLLAAPAALALAGGLAWIGSAAATDTPLGGTVDLQPQLDRKSTRLNSSHT